MPESVESWWARRQFSKASEVPYPIGTFRTDWERYPVLIRQYFPDQNHGITLTQIPPAAEVYLLWTCEVGHRFAATPQEQRDRPSRGRRRSSWCPVCAELAVERSRAPRKIGPRAAPPARRKTPGGTGRIVGEAFVSTLAPAPASAAESLLRQGIALRFDFDLTLNAVRVSQPFFDRLEVWPDIVIDELRIAIEYDTVGRHGLEHVGPREETDRRKDRLLRLSGWEVIRIRIGKLQPLGPFDLVAASVNRRLLDRLEERFAELRGDLIVSAYRRDVPVTSGASMRG